MSDLHWLRDVPDGTLAYEVNPDTSPGNAGYAIVTRSTWERIGAYEKSIPTSPSPGRVYRQGPWLKIVEQDPADDGYAYHWPCLVEIVEDDDA